MELSKTVFFFRLQEEGKATNLKKTFFNLKIFFLVNVFAHVTDNKRHVRHIHDNNILFVGNCLKGLWKFKYLLFEKSSCFDHNTHFFAIPHMMPL
jgi:hypothetical protein